MTVAICMAALAGLPAAAQSDLRPPAPLPEGVSPAVARAVEKGIDYLVQNQEAEGFWGATPSQPQIYPVAMTGLAGLALLAHGDTPTRGEHAEAVRKLADFLISTSSTSHDDYGLFTTGREDEPRSRKGPRPMYGHAYAMTFLAQIYGQEGDPKRQERIREVLKRAISLTARTQTDDGGWGYRADWWEDEGTLTVTQLQALRTCRDAGFLVPRSVIDRGVKFIESSTTSSGWVRYRVKDQDDTRPGVTCAAVVALWNAGQYDSPLLRRIMDTVNRSIHHDWEDGKHAEYVEYYLAQAKWIMGDPQWSAFYRIASADLVRLQQADGHWEGSDEDRYGTTFATAIALIVLQLPYNRLPVYQR